jgi:hypothetical protein
MRYEGYDGQLEVDGDALVLTREGKAAGLAFGSDVPARRIPLAAVAGARLTPATWSRAGWLHHMLGAEPAAELSYAQATSSPDAVLFLAADGEAFAALHQWLEHVANVNRDSGIDPATVPYDRGWNRAQRPAREPEPAAPQPTPATQQDGVRPDVAAVLARHPVDNARREIEHLDEFLGADETVVDFVAAASEADTVLLVVTDRRLFRFQYGWWSREVDEIPLAQITAVNCDKSLTWGWELVVHAAGRSEPLEALPYDDDYVTEFVTALRTAVARATGPAPAAEPPTADTDDPVAQLERLAALRQAGMLSQEEFESAKARVLGAP